MITGIRGSICVFICLTALIAVAAAQEPAATATPATVSTAKVFTFKPNYVPPMEILTMMGARPYGGGYVLDWRLPDGNHYVDLRVNDAANLIIVSGVASDVDHAVDLIRAVDVAPRQIEIEVKIVRINASKARNIGFDWESLFDRTRASGDLRFYNREYNNDIQTVLNSEVLTSFTASDVIHILDSSGVAEIRNAPRILTLNNRRANILDGQRIAYVSKFGSYSSLYEIDTMDAGLTMTVTPSLAESGYITLKIDAEYTQLATDRANGLFKDGQMLENTVVVKDGESALLGGLTQTVNIKAKKRFPLLGHVLPFLFSRETTISENIESFMVLTPRVVDFAPTSADVVPAAGDK